MVFVASIAIPTCRMYSLSTALWFAACGPFLTGVAILAGLAIVANSAVMNGDHFSVAVSGLQKILWRGSAVAGLIGVAIAATAIAWVHQFVIHRMTFALFRVYVTAVCTGIGSVLGLFLFLLLNYFHNVYAFLSVLIGSLSLALSSATPDIATQALSGVTIRRSTPGSRKTSSKRSRGCSETSLPCMNTRQNCVEPTALGSWWSHNPGLAPWAGIWWASSPETTARKPLRGQRPHLTGVH